MTPEEICRIYRREREATDEEFVATTAEVARDPEAARRLLAVLYSLSVEDRDFATLLRLFLEGMLMRQIEERAAEDDAYALECGALITDLMRMTMRPPRGKPGKGVKTV